MNDELKSADWALKRMQTRQSVRSFTDKPIPEQVLHAILNAGINAATGGNLQPYSIIVEHDLERNQQLCTLCGDQSFIAQAPVNLIFLIDWYKIATYSRLKNAPFVANKSFDHYTIGVDDLLCAAQTIETAAWLYGIGSCYVGTVLDVIPQVSEMYHLPKLVAPVLILSLGYSKKLTARRKKLPFEMVIFEGDYPALTHDQIIEAYDEKYRNMKTLIPSNSKRRKEFLSEFKRALLTTYNEEKSEQIIRAAEQDGYITEIQRRFGLHYHAADSLNPRIIQFLADQGIYPFYSW